MSPRSKEAFQGPRSGMQSWEGGSRSDQRTSNTMRVRQPRSIRSTTRLPDVRRWSGDRRLGVVRPCAGALPFTRRRGRCHCGGAVSAEESNQREGRRHKNHCAKCAADVWSMVEYRRSLQEGISALKIVVCPVYKVELGLYPSSHRPPGTATTPPMICDDVGDQISQAMQPS